MDAVVQDCIGTRTATKLLREGEREFTGEKWRGQFSIFGAVEEKTFWKMAAKFSGQENFSACGKGRFESDFKLADSWWAIW